MEKLFKIPMLKIMYQARAEELEKYINNSNIVNCTDTNVTVTINEL